MPRPIDTAICSIVIPAYNEATTIGHTLQSLLNGAMPGEFEVIVVCNGCHDASADVARAAAPEAHVVELAEAGKTAALNAGVAAASIKPVVFLDADIRTCAASVRALVAAVRKPGTFLACGYADFATKESSAMVRAFYRAWQLNPYFDKGKMGGFFAVSAEGLARLGSLPATTNDDEYINRCLGSDAVFVDEAPYRIEAPRTLGSLMQVRSRVYRGNAELKDSGISAEQSSNSTARRFILRLLSQPKAWPGAMVFFAVALAAHIRNRFQPKSPVWEQDQSTRQMAGGG